MDHSSNSDKQNKLCLGLRLFPLASAEPGGGEVPIAGRQVVFRLAQTPAWGGTRRCVWRVGHAFQPPRPDATRRKPVARALGCSGCSGGCVSHHLERGIVR